jgi:hypothetical protein
MDAARIPCVRTLAYVGTACCLFFCAVAALPKQNPSSVNGDDSDWWSTVEEYLRTDSSAHGTNLQHRELPASSQEIANVKLGFGVVREAQTKLGLATVVSRGDAAFSRTQVCYVASDSHTHLVFEEQGEGFGASFYLFQDGRNWNGSELCWRLSLNSQQLQTPSGLRLGLTRTDVEAVLGKPSTESPDRLTYDLEAKKRTPAAKLEQLRQQNSDLSDKDFDESFDFYYEDWYVIAKFNDSKLVYLTVTESESYP